MRIALIPTVATVAMLALTVSLGNWQVRRGAEKEQLQARRDAAMTAPPIAVGATPIDPASVDGHRIAVTGRFSPPRTVFLENRTRKGIAGFHVFTPLQIESAVGGERWILVLRGWVARDVADRARLPEIPTPVEPVRLVGLAQATLAQALTLGPIPVPSPADRLWSVVSLERYAEWSGLPLQPVVLRQTSELQDGLARDWVQPGGGVEQHRGYAFQWYALAATTLALWVWFTFRRPREDASGEPDGRRGPDAGRGSDNRHAPDNRRSPNGRRAPRDGPGSQE